MLVAPGGQERTVEEFVALLTAAGFELRDVTETSSGLAVLEGVPVQRERRAPRPPMACSPVKSVVLRKRRARGSRQRGGPLSPMRKTRECLQRS